MTGKPPNVNLDTPPPALHSNRAVVALSGGVDSSLAAALLVEAGYDVVAVMMRLWPEDENRCCAPQAVEDARRVAALLGIPFHLVDYRAEFRASVVARFVAEYSRARTPNPCLDCNRHIRFGRLLGEARALGARFLATGHYARIDEQGGEYRLRMGLDPHKDQSYVLYMLSQSELDRVRFPIGAYTKPQVRDMARARGLPVADREESMDICFVPDGDYRRFLRQHSSASIQPGPIHDPSGRQIGRHHGLPFYTVGQRKGLGVAASEPLYVLRIEPTTNTLVVGPASSLGRQELSVSDVHYVSGRTPDTETAVQIKIRYRALLADGMWLPLPDHRARVSFRAPLRDITPGQAAVAYQGDVVVGGGIIEE